MPRKVCVRHSEAVVHALLICRMILFIIIGNAWVIFLRISFFRNELLVFANIISEALSGGAVDRSGIFGSGLSPSKRGAMCE